MHEILMRMPEDLQKVDDPGETRTRNLLIRSQTPYPLGHGAIRLKEGMTFYEPLA